jgi:ubiquinone/menaquinone biosynthesis C-methylase UbiE
MSARSCSPRFGWKQPDGQAAAEPLESPADHLDLPDWAVDAVYCQQGVQFMSDRHAAITKVLRVLRPGGAFGVAINGRSI